MLMYFQYNREAEHRLPEVELLIDELDNRDVEQVRTSISIFSTYSVICFNHYIICW
jgi:hypothetical protein